MINGMIVSISISLNAVLQMVYKWLTTFVYD